MPDETTAALQEIAGLLRRRVEQQEQMAQRSEERLSKIGVQPTVTAQIDKIREDGEVQLAEMSARMQERDEQARSEKERLQEEDRQFKQRLIAELERHNLLLERLLSRMS